MCELSSKERPAVSNLSFNASDLWYEGALLGNGDLGAVVFGAKDRISFALGKNDMWDRRRYFHYYKPITFRRYMEMVRDEWPADPETGYMTPQKSGYETLEPVPQGYFPTPKPVCRISIWQPDKKTESGMKQLAPITHELSIEDAELITNMANIRIQSRIQKNENLLFINISGITCETYVSLQRKPDGTNTGILPPEYRIDKDIGLVIQEIPPERTFPEGFRCAASAYALNGSMPELSEGEILWKLGNDCTIVAAAATTLDENEPEKAVRNMLREAAANDFEKMREQHRQQWKAFWEKSWVRMDDCRATHIWYFCNYLLASSVRPGCVAPGLFGPWIVEDTSAWHGSYTTDYNFEQEFAAALSCNHPELLEPYFKTIENMLPAAREFAKDIFEAEGIAFPHEIFPINMHGQIHAGSVYICETPWLIQHFWEYFEYTLDMDFLLKRAYPVISEVADFLAGYVVYEGDGKYSFIPTRSPEHHGLIRGLPFNRNGAPELAFARYLLKAAIKASEITNDNSGRAAKWKEVLNGLPGFPRSRNQLGEVYIDCEAPSTGIDLVPPVKLSRSVRPSKTKGNHGPWMYYNCPTSIFQVWPAGQVDMDSPYDEYLTAVRTWHTLKLEGSNDLVMRHAAAARLGMPTLEQFKSDVAERMVMNGAISMKVNPVSKEESYNTGYFNYETNGIYTENCGLPVVINEMMLQSHNGVIKLFPALDHYRQAEFHNLRAKGGFTVSAEVDRGFIKWAEIKSLVDMVCRVRLPWPYKIAHIKDKDSGVEVSASLEENDLVFKTTKNRIYLIEPECFKSSANI